MPLTVSNTTTDTTNNDAKHESTTPAVHEEVQNLEATSSSVADVTESATMRESVPQQPSLRTTSSSSWTARRALWHYVPSFSWMQFTTNASSSIHHTMTTASNLFSSSSSSSRQSETSSSTSSLKEDDDDTTATKDDQTTNCSEATPLLTSSFRKHGRRRGDKQRRSISNSSLHSCLKLDEVYDDVISEMTWSRRLARYLAQFSWYYPHQEGTNLDAAWAYFEHTTLARYIVRQSHHYPPDDNDNNNTNNNTQQQQQQQQQQSTINSKSQPEFTTLFDAFPKADAGATSSKTRLYPVIDLPESQLADFGVGVAVYFYTLRALAVIMLVAGIISIPNLIYFASSRYNTNHHSIRTWSLKASAVCTDQTWVACPSCTLSQWDYFPRTYNRYATSTNPVDGSIIHFILINNCNIHRLTGIMSSICLVYVCMAMSVLFRTSKLKEEEFDRFSQTTRDYSLEVTNPPKDATDPQEWRDFFQPFGHVTSVTVVLHNYELVSQLIQRRQYIAALTNLLPPGCDFMYDDQYQVAVNCAKPVPWYMKWMGSQDASTLQKKILQVEEHITSDLAKRTYRVSAVFVVMECEDDKERALEALSVPAIHFVADHAKQVIRGRDPSRLFRGQHVLQVKEPPEPSSVRWQDLHPPFSTLLVQRIKSAILTLTTILVGCALVIYTRWFGTVAAAIMVSAVNTAAPMACRFITTLESHSSEGGVQTSLYLKITACLWFTTAMLTSIITPFVDSLENKAKSLVPAMYAIFLTEMLKAPVTQLADIPGQLNRHFFAPRATNQKQMNSFFQGTSYQLSERYTDMSNVLFLTFYYAFLFPAGYFFAAATLAVHYWTDKFCLLRNWAPAPMVGTNIAEMSRNYFFTFAVAVYAIMSSYYFACFPYDNACSTNNVAPSNYVGTFNATTGAGASVHVVVHEGDEAYKFCNQDLSQYPPVFPAVPSKQPADSKWMTDDQAFFARFFGWIGFSVFVTAIAIFLNLLRRRVTRFCCQTYLSPSWKKNRPPPPNFSEIPDIFTYLPQTKIPGDDFPILFCNMEGLQDTLIPWVDPLHSYNYHNVKYDLPSGVLRSEAFGTVQYWPPSPPKVPVEASKTEDTPIITASVSDFTTTLTMD